MTEPTQGSGRRAPSDEEIKTYLPHSTTGREARVGGFVIIGLLSFVVVLFQLTDPAWFRQRHLLYSVVNDAGGVRVGDPIQMRGVNIGRISDFEMTNDSAVTMELEIEKGWRVPLGSAMEFGVAGMFGGRTVEVIPTMQPAMHESGDTIPGVGGRAGGMLGSIDDLSEQAGSVMTQMESLLNNETIESVQGGAREFEALLLEVSSVVSEQRAAMSTLIETLQASAEGIQGAAEAGPELASAIARADSVMLALSETSADLDGALATVRSILDKIDGGDGTFAKLLNDDALYVSLTDASDQFLALLEDLRANPKKYINLSIF